MDPIISRGRVHNRKGTFPYPKATPVREGMCGESWASDRREQKHRLLEISKLRPMAVGSTCWTLGSPGCLGAPDLIP